MTSPGTRTCDKCGAAAPVTETGFTLIGTKHAWRCTKVAREDGSSELRWYCPDCWKKTRPNVKP